MKEQKTDRRAYLLAGVWVARLFVGCVFIISGWAKAIDPWGFVIKVREYLDVWGFEIPSELIVTGCVSLACVEFCTGILVATGCLKRVSVWVAAAMMAVMLPLTVYIAVANPVSDCGCFGDFIIMSNGMTLAKNVVITAAIVFLIIYNRRFRGLYPGPIQWIVITVSLAFPLCLAFVGYNVQPLVDFRPYKIGSLVFSPEGQDDTAAEEYIYEKDGRRQSFALDNLPDSTWTFVDVAGQGVENASMGVYDSDGEDVSADLANAMQDMLILVIPNPDLEYLSRAHYVNELYEYVRRHDTRMIAILGDSGEILEQWKELVRPRFEVFTAEDTSLEQMSRGEASVVFVREGIIVWKRTLASLDASLPESTLEGNALDDISPVDDGKRHLAIVLIYLISLAATYLLGLSPKILRRFARTKKIID